MNGIYSRVIGEVMVNDYSPTSTLSTDTVEDTSESHETKSSARDVYICVFTIGKKLSVH